MFDAWKELFIWLLGLATSLSLYILNNLRIQFEQMAKDIKTLMKDREVEREIVRRAETDRRREVVDFMGMENRSGVERRADGWPVNG